MLKCLNKILAVTIVFFCIAVLFIRIKVLLATGNPVKEQNTPAMGSNSTVAQAKPVIIWFHCVNSNPLESLRYVLSSGIATHVMVLYMHRADADWKTSDKTMQAIKMVKDSDAK